MSAAINATTLHERESVIAYLLDRAEQYDNNSGYRALFDDLVQELAEGRHADCRAAGEYDDLHPRVARIIRIYRNG